MDKDFLSDLVKAALLHDIGKLLQRADRRVEGVRNAYHEEIGAHFAGIFSFDKSIAQGILRHHRRSFHTDSASVREDRLASLVYEADNIAAASERRPADEPDTAFDREMSLKSVFSSLCEGAEDSFYPPRKLKESPIYPNAQSSDSFRAEYEKLGQALTESLKEGDFEIERLSCDSLMEILEDAESYITSDTYRGNNGDISLFDHVKMTAAIASCLAYREDADKPYLLVSGDISGIQDFIYTVASKGALRSLRGRSFYLDFMLEHIAQEILDNIGILRCNLLYTGGGHFYILAPNTQEVKEKLKNARIAVNSWFIKNFGVALYLAMDYVEASGDILKKGVRELFKGVNEKLSRQKSARYGKEELLELTAPQPHKDFSRECVICGNSGELSEHEKLGLVCANCRHLYEAGKNLIDESVKTLYVFESEGAESALELPSLSGKRKYLSFEEEKNAHVYALNHRKAGAIRVFAGKYRKEGDFKELLKDGKGIKRLGVLRADVDDLGRCFTEGFKEGYDTFTRTAVLSRQLSLFFKYFVNAVAKGDLGDIDRFYLDNKPLEGKPSLAVVYAGGDDLFVVGHWLDVINFAVDLRRAFTLFTAGRMTFSAGIGFFHESYPISEMARLTGELEEKAKGNGKDSVALFGASADSVYKWKEFEDKVVPKVGELNALNLPAATLYRLKALLGEREKPINIARLAYTLARALEEKDKLKIYGWAGNEKRSFLTALDLVIYLNREVEDDK